MLNKDGQRMLCYVATVDDILPIEGYDRVEHAAIGGWRVIVSKSDNFQPGDKCVYFEIDSLINGADERFAFMAKRKYRVKTIKMCGTVSQGLVMPLSAFPEVQDPDIGTDLTEILKVKYYEPEDNQRKANFDPYRSMMDRHKALFKKSWVKKIMRYAIGRKIMFALFGKKKEKATAFPTQFPFVRRTDQERVENMPWVLTDKTPFIVTQKCDGSSGTYLLQRKRFGKFEFYVCSRNVRQLAPESQCFYDENYYWQVAQKYNIEEKLKNYLQGRPDLDYACWQGEICGPSIQKNPHGLKELHFFAFHMITSDIGKWDIREAAKVWNRYNIETVPIVHENYILPDDMEDFKLEADGFYSRDCCEGLGAQPREGFVYYKTNDPNFSFKNVSREYLLKH